MTVGDCRWPLYCLSSPLFPVLWHLLQLNVATTTPLFLSSIHCLLGLPWWRKPSTLPSKTVNAKFPALPLHRSTVVSSEPPSPLTSFPDQSLLLILIYWYGILSKKFRASFSSTTSQKTRVYFYPISLMSIPPNHTETLPRRSTSSLWFSTQTWRFCPYDYHK